MQTIASIKLSKHTSQFGIVKAVEDLMLSPGFPTEMEGRNGRRSVPTIFVVQALPYVANIKGDPWSPNYPSQAAVVEACRDGAGVEVILV